MDSLLSVGMEVEQSGDEVLNEAQRLTCHIPSLQLNTNRKYSRCKLCQNHYENRALTALRNMEMNEF